MTYYLGVGVFLACAAFLLIGRRIERTLEILNWVLVTTIFATVAVLCMIFAPAERWVAAGAGFFGLDPARGSFHFLPQGADWFLIGAFAAYGTPIGGLQAAGVLVTMAGVAIIASGGEATRLASLTFNAGDLLMIAACALYAGYTVGLSRRPPVSPLSLFTGLACAAFVTSLPLALGEAALGRYQWPTPAGWLIVALVTLFPSFLAQIFFIQGVVLIGPGRAGIFVNLVPVFASSYMSSGTTWL